MGDKTRKIQVRLSEDELLILKWLGKYDAEGMSDWICQAIKARAGVLEEMGYTLKVMRSQV